MRKFGRNAAGRAPARPAAVHAGVLLAAAVLMATGCTATGGRAAIKAGYGLLLARHDANRDGALDRQEIEAMVDAAVPPERRRGGGWDALRAWLVARYVAQDRDGDGRLGLDELVRGPLAAFQCIDADASGRVTPAEIEARWAGCAIDNL